jgi:hypothetical protein
VKAIELADFRSFAAAARRSLVLRIAAALAAIALAAAAVALAPRTSTTRDPLLARNRAAIVVLDVSASISWDTYARIASELDRLRRSGGRVGLVLFSDTAYQALPPGTPASQLASFERFFVVRQPTQPGFQPQPPRSPWTDQFSAGTRISTGLGLALEVIREEHLRRPSVLLVSDLDDDTTDLESLTSVALAYRRLGVPISVAGLNPSPQDASYMRRLLPQGGTIANVPLEARHGAGGGPQIPWTLVALTLAVGILLAALLVVTQRLRWAEA